MLQKFSQCLSFFSSFTCDLCNSNVGVFTIVPKVSEAFLNSFHSFPFILLFSSYFHHSINGNPLQYPCLEYLMDKRSLVGCSPWGHKESGMTERLTLTYLSSSSLIHSSASVILLLVPSRVFLISVIVIHLCLLILYFFYVLDDCIKCVKCFLHFLHSIFKFSERLYYHYSKFSFRESSFFLFVYLFVCLFVCFLSFYLALSLVLYFCLFIFFFFFNLLHLKSPFPRL